MKVYRCMCEEELNKILNHDLENIGNFFDERYSNTFKYRKNEKYKKNKAAKLFENTTDDEDYDSYDVDEDELADDDYLYDEDDI